jgi:hypothetical protein
MKVIDGGFVKPDDPIFSQGLRIVSAKKLGWSMQNSSESTSGTGVEKLKGKVKKARLKSRKKR